MGRMTLIECIEYQKQERKRIRRLTKGKKYIKPTAEDKVAIELDTTVYRLEFPKKNMDVTLRELKRITEYLRYSSANMYPIVAIVALSTHRAWTSYTIEYGRKGGHGKKVFYPSDEAKRQPHLHVYITGKGARSIVERLYDNTKKHYMKNGISSLPPFRRFAFSEKHLPLSYVKFQATNYRIVGDLDGYIKEHRVDK